MKKVFFVLLVGLLCLSCLGACASSPAPSTDGRAQYNANPGDALNYSLYTNKEISLVMNELEAHMANAMLVQNGDYPIEDEIANVTASIDLTKEAVKSVETLAPTNEYEDDRDEILRRLVNAQSTLEGYKKCLEDGDLSKLGQYADLMQGDFIALKAMFNNVWE